MLEDRKRDHLPAHVTEEFLARIKLPSPEGRRLNYLLVMPQIAESSDTMYIMPYGFCLVSSALKASGRKVVTINLNYKDHPYELLSETILENQIDVVAAGGLSGQFDRLKQIFDVAKAVNPQIITIAGGGVISADPAVAMRALETVDCGIIGEGEFAINDVAYALEHDLDMKTVPGLVLPDGTITPRRPEIEDLDILPFPDYDGLELELVLRKNLNPQSWFENCAVGITLSRSCPYQCTFCFHPSGSKYRRRSLDNIFEEIEWLLSHYKVEFLIINDELFISDETFLSQFCHRIAQYQIGYWVQTRVDTVTKDILEQLKMSGCRVVSYGVESADNRILKSMRKNITVRQIERAFDLANEVGIPAYGNLILGDIEETQESIRNSLNWWRDHPRYNIFILYILTFPGTYLYKYACQKGIIADPVDYLRQGHQQINVTKLSDQEYWETTLQIELFQLAVASGIYLDFHRMDEAKEILRRNLENLASSSKLAIWPAMFSTVNLLHYISPAFVSSKNVYFVNRAPNDTRLQGMERFHKAVYEPSVMKHESIPMVLFSYTQAASANRVFEQIGSAIQNSCPSVKQIIKLPELLNPNFNVNSLEGIPSCQNMSHKSS